MTKELHEPPAPPEARGRLLYLPPADIRSRTRMGAFLDWIERKHDVTLANYDEAWQWSVAHLDTFWADVVEFAGLRFSREPEQVKTGSMPQVRWFPGGELNYADQALSWADQDQIVVVSYSESRPVERLSRAELTAQVASLRHALVELGIGKGDRVAAYLPATTEALVAMLATASLGAIWTSLPPEYGAENTVSRLDQVEPKVLFAVSGYRYGGRDFDRSEELELIRKALPSVQATVWRPHGPGQEQPPGTVVWDDLIQHDVPMAYEQVPFDHPLCILYSSGTTGVPKAIVHGHGGLMAEHMKWLMIHDELGPQDRHFWYSTVGWMAWNHSMSALLCGASVLMYDGSLDYPDRAEFWRMIAADRVTTLGISPGFLTSCEQDGVRPRDIVDLTELRTITCGGAPVPAGTYEWGYRSINDHLYFGTSSGGTEVGGAFVGGTRLVAVRAGEIPCRLLGCDAQVFDAEGHPVTDTPGELVVVQPMPSMLVGFYGDEDGSMLRAAYFSQYDGVWCHGDWATMTSEGSLIIHGRSDATLNRGGVRLGTSEFYSVLERIDGVRDSLIIHLEDSDGGLGILALFIALQDGVDMTEHLSSLIRNELRQRLSPRHAPDRIVVVPEIPRTSNGKRMEVPVKKVLRGARAVDMTQKKSGAVPSSLTWFEGLAL